MHFAAIAVAGATVSQRSARQGLARLYPGRFSSLGGQNTIASFPGLLA